MVIIFDLFGVIFSKGLKSSIDKLISIYDLPKGKIEWAYKKWELPFDKGEIDSFEFWHNVNTELGKNINITLLNDLVISSYYLNPDIEKLILHLKSRFQLIVYSNYRHEWFLKLDKKFNISDNFDKIFISSQTKKIKPDHNAFDIIKNYTKKPNFVHCLIDDNNTNVQSFKNWGGKAIKFENIYYTELKIRDLFSNKFEATYKIKYSGIILIHQKEFVVLQRRDNNSKIDNPNMLSVFGGRAIENEDSIECAIRELKEETSINAQKTELFLFKELSYPLNHSDWILCSYYLYNVFDLNNIILNEGQNYEVKKISDAAEHNEVTSIPKYLFRLITKI